MVTSIYFENRGSVVYMKRGEDYVGVAVVYFCHDGKGNVVLSKRGAKSRDEHGTWDPGGGGVDFGERVEDALRREVREEYSADIIEYEFLGVRDVHRTEKGVRSHWIALDYKVLVDPTQVANGEPHKLDAVEWFSMTNLPEPLHSQFPGFLELYHGRL
jgi:ADP-ribose pyrophosphatase YjhB (NUDIX family)